MPPISGEAQALFRLAQAAARTGRKVQARRLLWAALKLEPNHADLWVWLAGVASSPRASLGYLARALTLEPDNQQARAGLRWARRQAEPAPQTEAPLPARRSRPAAGGLRGHWVYGTIIAALTVVVLLGAILLPDLDALAAGEPQAIRASMRLFTPTSMAVLPTRTSEVPPTWTPTHTPTPSHTPTPLPTITSTPSSTPTPVYPSPTWVPAELPTPISPGADGARWIDVNLTEQLVIAYEGATPVRWIPASTGLRDTPTVTGQYAIYIKYLYTDMSGDDYDLKDVPYTMYFYKGYGLHGAYWHNSFGRPMSHGCVNLPVPESEWLYEFADIGTLVNIHY